MSLWNITLFGSPRVERAGETVEIERRKATALLAYLAVTGQTHTRDALAAMFWPDSDPSRAYAYLRTTLWTLNKALGDGWLQTEGDTISIDPAADLSVDVRRFRQLVREAVGASYSSLPDVSPMPTIESYQAAAELYEGDFLAGFTLPDSSAAFDDWVFFERESLRRELAAVLEILVNRLTERQDFSAAIPFARRWLALDNLHEAAHRALMKLYAWTDQRAAALRQYQTCADTLRQAVGAAPEAATRELHQMILERRLAIPDVLPVGTRHTVSLLDPTPAAPHKTATSTLLAIRMGQLNLPTQVTPFVSREQERADIARLLADPACHLLTLLGPGGIGKTRLAIQVARDVAETFEHGVYFVSLAPVTSAESIIPAIADALQIFGYQQEQRAIASKLYDFLREKQLLLVLDNVEHLLDGANVIADLLQHAPQIVILTTSRERLNLHEEWVYDTPGLSFPQNGRLDSISEFGAVQLFLQTARRVRPDFVLTDGDRPHIARICRSVEGHPLAVELAAAWIQILTCEEIAQEITRSLDFLSASHRNLPQRHQSIRAVFETSWEALPAQEKGVMSKLSIFRGGFTRDAAQAVAGASLLLLRALVNKSLVSVDVFGRYDLHELLRQFAEEKLAAMPDEQRSAYDRHLEFYAGFLKRHEPGLKGRDQIETFTLIDLETENMRVAWRWAIQQCHLPHIQTILDGMTIFLGMRSRIVETRDVCTYALENLRSDDDSLQVIRAQIQIALASAYDWEANRQARQLCAEAEPALRDLDHDELGVTFILLARIYSWIDMDMNTGVAYGKKAWHIFERTGDRWGAAFALRVIGDVYHHHVHYRESGQYYREALALSRAVGDRWGEAETLRRLAEVEYTLGHYDEAERLCRNALAFGEESNGLPELSFNLAQLAKFICLQGRYDEARAFTYQSLEIITQLGYRYSQGWHYFSLASYDAWEGRYDSARSWFQKGLDLFREIDNGHGTGWILLEMSEVAFKQGNTAEAEQHAREGMRVLKQLDDKWGIAGAHYQLARLETAAGALETALAHLIEAVRLDVDNDSIMMLCRHLYGYGCWLAAAGKPEHAVEVLALTANHHASWANIRSDADELLTQLREEVPEAAFQAAYAHGLSLAVAAVVEEMMGQS